MVSELKGFEAVCAFGIPAPRRYRLGERAAPGYWEGAWDPTRHASFFWGGNVGLPKSPPEKREAGRLRPHCTFQYPVETLSASQ